MSFRCVLVVAAAAPAAASVDAQPYPARLVRLAARFAASGGSPKGLEQLTAQDIEQPAKVIEASGARPDQ